MIELTKKNIFICFTFRQWIFYMSFNQFYIKHLLLSWYQFYRYIKHGKKNFYKVERLFIMLNVIEKIGWKKKQRENKWNIYVYNIIIISTIFNIFIVDWKPILINGKNFFLPFLLLLLFHLFNTDLATSICIFSNFLFFYGESWSLSWIHHHHQQHYYFYMDLRKQYFL